MTNNLRKMFKLSESDTAFLDSLGLPWEAVTEGGVNRVIINDFPIPKGYNIEKVSLHLRIEAGYPDVQIDMVYFYPDLTRNDNIAIRTIAAESFDGKVWQRWSRHRTGEAPWRPGLDDISTHMALIREWLNLELLKN